MASSLIFTEEATANLRELERDRGLSKRLRAVRKTLAFLETNSRHSSLQTHEYKSLGGPSGEKVFEAYAEQSTPAAYRVFWHYGPEKGQITIIAITVTLSNRRSRSIPRARRMRDSTPRTKPPDGHPRGLPIVRNGLALCKLHVADFDSHILGVRPELTVDIREDILHERDGPMLLITLHEPKRNVGSTD